MENNDEELKNVYKQLIEENGDMEDREKRPKNTGSKTAYIVLIIVLILPILIYISIVCFVFKDDIKIWNQSLKQEKLLNKWLENSGWKDEVKITKTQFRNLNEGEYYDAWNKNTNVLGCLDLYIEYNNKNYTTFICNGESDDYNNARIFFAIH